MGWLRRNVLLACFALLAVAPSGLRAQTPAIADVLAALRLPELAELMRAEGLDHAADIESQMLPGGGGGFWARRTDTIYDADRIVAIVGAALDSGLTEAHRTEVLTFFESPRGRRILSHEVAARAAMAEPEVEDIARASYDALRGSDDPRLARIASFVEANDLVELNLAGALGANLQFYRGLVDGRALDMSEAEILSNVWTREDETRATTESWLFGYLLMAYQPLGDADIDEYIAFSRSAGGAALNSALFSGFDILYRNVSYELGLAAATAMSGSDL
ncbi:MAG: DUF2059 domain-containing protein [Rhodobacteraceae bacterium]|nr:DUF2059 domain-containing protein [Paracoccaceae bacterium]